MFSRFILAYFFEKRIIAKIIFSIPFIDNNKDLEFWKFRLFLWCIKHTIRFS